MEVKANQYSFMPGQDLAPKATESVRALVPGRDTQALAALERAAEGRPLMIVGSTPVYRSASDVYLPKPDPCATTELDPGVDPWENPLPGLYGPCAGCGASDDLNDAYKCSRCAACAALRASLPVSAEFVQSNVAGGKYQVALAATNAEADLRKRAGTLRAWPTCPSTGVALEIRAEVQTEDRGLAGLNRETLRTWHAAFCCPSCGGGT